MAPNLSETSLKKWKLLSSSDVSPSEWFPVENRVYELPNGNLVDDFTVTTLADVSLIIPITTDKKIVMVRQYKPGVDDFLLQFPGGRLESAHGSLDETALRELAEETGIQVTENQLQRFARFTGFATKASEVVHFYIATECEFNAHQHLDPTEEIEILLFTSAEIDELISTNQIWCSQTVAGWVLAKQQFLHLLK